MVLIAGFRGEGCIRGVRGSCSGKENGMPRQYNFTHQLLQSTHYYYLGTLAHPDTHCLNPDTRCLNPDTHYNYLGAHLHNPGNTVYSYKQFVVLVIEYLHLPVLHRGESIVDVSTQ